MACLTTNSSLHVAASLALLYAGLQSIVEPPLNQDHSPVTSSRASAVVGKTLSHTHKGRKPQALGSAERQPPPEIREDPDLKPAPGSLSPGLEPFISQNTDRPAACVSGLSWPRAARELQLTSYPHSGQPQHLEQGCTNTAWLLAPQRLGASHHLLERP